MCHFQAQKSPFILNKIFLVQTIIITFIYLLVLFIVQNLKNSYNGSRVMRIAIFGAKMVHLPQFFFGKKINIIFIYLLAPFTVQNFKKFFTPDPELWGCTILGPKMAHLPEWEFFQKTCYWALFLSFMRI